MSFIRQNFRISYLLCLLVAIGIYTLRLEGYGAGKLLDGWYELDRIVTLKTVDWQEPRTERSIAYDTTNKVFGDFSIKYDHEAGTDVGRMVFNPFPSSTWKLSEKASLNFWLCLKTVEEQQDLELSIEVRDQLGRVASMPFKFQTSPVADSWVQFDSSLSSFQGSEVLDYSAITEVSIAGLLEEDLIIMVDAMHFKMSDPDASVIGVTSKSVSQRMNEAQASRDQRARIIYSGIASREDSTGFDGLFAQFWMGDNLGAANAALEQLMISEMNKKDSFYWNLNFTSGLLRIYFTYGPGEGDKRNLLSDPNCNLLLELVWERTKAKNDIHWARQRNPWIMDGSENHDMNSVVSNYLSSYIFKEHPKFKNRVYPNSGKGGGIGYWFHNDREEKVHIYGPPGKADLADGRDYYPADHYEAWGKVIRDMVTARMEKGFFLENASPSYMKYTLGFLMDVYTFDGSERTRALVKEFLDVVWIQWALESLHGQRGGAKTRDHTVLSAESDSMYQMGRFLLGGFLTRAKPYYWLPANPYEFPELVWKTALDRTGLGEFALIARAIGEEPADLPREPGLERSLNLNTEHRMFRYSWITPHSIMGAQMDHPLAVHSHLSPTSRSYGINFSNHPDARISPLGVRRTGDDNWAILPRGGPMYRAVQHEHVLLSQQSRGYIQVGPDWFPQRSLSPLPIGIYFSPKIDIVVERGGWIFAQSGNGYAAVRIVEGEYMAGDGIEETTSFVDHSSTDSNLENLRKDSYQWNRNKTVAIANNALAGLVMETSSIDRHENLEAFMREVLDARLELQRTVVPGWYTLVYKGTGNAPRLELNLSNNEVPQVDGVSIDYEPYYLFDSPYLRSVYGSGRIEAEFDTAP